MMGTKNKVAPCPTSKKIDFDAILEHIGPIGKWQWFHIILCNMVPMAAGMAVVTFAFTGFVPKYRCLIPQCENLQNATYFGTDTNELNNTSLSDYVKLSMTKDKCTKLEPSVPVGSCEELKEMLIKYESESRVVTCDKEEVIFDQSIVENWSSHVRP